MAEMALVPSIYRKYATNIVSHFDGVAPGITSRFEVFTDETFTQMKEHTCWVQFIPHDSSGSCVPGEECLSCS
ncbi:hypothetical protein GQ44DRAFT_713236 [Phaeosphaeriaceae sp. PMI808]|nr:hypothetical protein GQ44DRAFT_713236 [Phaeosphaeriaceae sp. PMI808]